MSPWSTLPTPDPCFRRGILSSWHGLCVCVCVCVCMCVHCSPVVGVVSVSAPSPGTVSAGRATPETRAPAAHRGIWRGVSAATFFPVPWRPAATVCAAVLRRAWTAAGAARRAVPLRPQPLAGSRWYAACRSRPKHYLQWARWLTRYVGLVPLGPQ